MNPHLARNEKYGKPVSLLIVTAAYLLALAGAVLAFPYSPWDDPILSVLFADIVGTVIIWLAGMPFSNASFYDPYWSVAPIPIAAYWWHLGGWDTSLRDILFTTVLIYWAIRLTSNWARDWPGLKHEDWRYQDIRSQTGPAYQAANLAGICMFPTLLVFLGMLPAYPVLSADNPPNLVFDLVAFAVGMGAVTIQLISDGQMRKFRRAPKGNEAIMTDGLWAWSRHPNYFGEVAMWFSLWLFALSAGFEHAWTGVGALAMFLLFWFISIPMMDNKSAKKRPGYADYMKESSRFFMVPPRSKSA